MTTPTSTPVPSTSPSDLLFNGEAFDTFVNGLGKTFKDRFGVSRPTVTGLIQFAIDTINSLLASQGYSPPVSYGSGLSMTGARQTVTYLGLTYAPNLADLPFTTSGTFETAKFRLVVGISAADLVVASGAGLIGTSHLGTGAIQRTVLQKLRDLLSSNDFSGASDTQSVQMLLTYAGNGGAGQRRVELTEGTRNLVNQGDGMGLKIGSDTRVDASGMKFFVPGVQNFYPFVALGSQITIENASIESESTSNTNDGQAQILFTQLGLGRNAVNLQSRFNYSKKGSWGIHASANSGTEKIIGFLSIGDMIDNDTLGQNDGIHVNGAVSGTRIAMFYVRNRGDAAVAISMTPAFNAGGGVIGMGVIENSQVAIDLAGPRRIGVFGVVAYNTNPNTASNPQYRVISYLGCDPEDILAVGVIAITNSSASGEYDTKVDVPSGAAVHAHHVGFLTRRSYVNAKKVAFAANMRKAGGQLVIGGGGQLMHGTEQWMDDQEIFYPATPSLAGPNYHDRQMCNLAIESNFMPTSVIWVASATLKNPDPICQLNPELNVGTANVEVCVFEIREPYYLIVSALADLGSHPGLLDIVNSSGAVVASYYFPTNPGTGATKVSCYPIGPTTNGYVRYPRLTRGVYSAVFRVQVGVGKLRYLNLLGWN